MSDNPSIQFTLDYAGALVYCSVFMQESSYDVHFNGAYVASLEHTDNLEWIQAAGAPLPQEIVDLIGGRIEGAFE